MIGLQIFKRFCKGTHRLFISRILYLYFGNKESILSADAAILYGIADGTFVAIAGGGVDHAIARFDGVQHACFTYARIRYLKDAEP